MNPEPSNQPTYQMCSVVRTFSYSQSYNGEANFETLYVNTHTIALLISILLVPELSFIPHCSLSRHSKIGGNLHVTVVCWVAYPPITILTLNISLSYVHVAHQWDLCALIHQVVHILNCCVNYGFNVKQTDVCTQYYDLYLCITKTATQ